MKNKFVFSIVIPLYNKEKYISRAVHSALNQNFNNFEIIIVNDGSTDKSLSVVKKIIDPRIKIITQKNLGTSSARNVGIKMAKAPYIAFLDADDEYMPGFLYEMSKLITQYKQYSFFASGYKKVSKDREEEYLYGKKKVRIIKNFLAEMAKTGKSFIHISSVIIKKSVFSDTGNFFMRQGLNYKGATIFEDIDLWIRISLRYSMVFLNQIGSVYYRNTNINTVAGYKFSKLDCSFYEDPLAKLIKQSKDSTACKYLIQMLYHLRNASASQLLIRGRLYEAENILNKQQKTKTVKNLLKMVKIKKTTAQLLFKNQNCQGVKHKK